MIEVYCFWLQEVELFISVVNLLCL